MCDMNSVIASLQAEAVMDPGGRAAEILRLVAEDWRVPHRGRLATELSFGSLAFEDEKRTDTEARLCPLGLTPEVILLKGEERVLRAEAETSALAAAASLGEVSQAILRDVLAGASVEELMVANGLPRQEMILCLVEVLKAVAPDCLERLDPDRARILSRILKAGDPDRVVNLNQATGGRIIVSPAAREIPLGTFHKVLQEAGFLVSRPTAWRAQQRGWFLADGRKGIGRRASLGFVVLSDAERALPNVELARLFGMARETAVRAKARGWIEVSSTNRDTLKVDPARIQQGDLPT